MASTKTRTTFAADRIDFIDKDNSWSSFFGFAKKITNTTCSNTHKHFHKFRTTHVEKRYIGLTSHCLGKECFSGARSTHEEDAFGDFCPHIRKFLRIFQK